MTKPTLQLQVTNSKTGEQSDCSVADERVRVGRSAKNELQLDHESVASEHAVFRLADGIWLTNLTSEGTTATAQGVMAIGDAVRITNGSKIQIGAFVITCTLITPTADFGMLIDASRLELPQLLCLPNQWRPGSVTIGGVPAALTNRTWTVLFRLASRPGETVSAMELVTGLKVESDGVDISRIVRTLRRQLATALGDETAHERISMSVNTSGDDVKATMNVLIESVRGQGYRLNLAPGLIAFD